jgi:Family of unknown function (DUF5681)
MLPEMGSEVGYKRPPVHTRFPKGQSGNPRGRRRGSKNWKTSFLEALAAKVPLTENGRRRRVSKQEAMFAQLANRAAQGDPRATQSVLRLQAEIERTSAQEKPAESKPERRRFVAILPHNGRGELHPDLKALYLKALQEFCDTHPDARNCFAPMDHQQPNGLDPDASRA